jgi:hypothetical protein
LVRAAEHIRRFIGIESHASESYYHSYTAATSGVNRLASQICHNRLFRKKLQQNILPMISTEVSSLAAHITGSTSTVPKGGTDSAGKRIGANGVDRDGRRRTCYNPICKSSDHIMMEKKCDRSGMRNYVEGQVNRNPKTSPSILFAMMDQYADEDTDIEENVIVK